MVTLKILTFLFFIFTHCRDESLATQSWILRYLQNLFISASVVFWKGIHFHVRTVYICIILFTLAQKIMHTRKRHQDMFQDLNRKLQHAEKDRESPPMDSKPGKRWSVSSGGSDKTNLSVSFPASLFFYYSFCLSVTPVLLISLPGWSYIKRLSAFLV